MRKLSFPGGCHVDSRRAGKKSPTILVFHHAASDRPGGELLYRSRLRHRVRPAAEALSDARYSWQVDGMDCAACARKVETAVRQVPGVSQVQVLFATEKLLVNAEGDVRAQVENAVRQAGYTLRDAGAPAAEQTRGRCCATICRY